MYRWFRLHNDAINNPKVLRLSDQLHRRWIGLLCIASKNEGVLRSIDDMAIMLRTTPTVLARDISKLVTARLIDDREGELRPHDWDEWQPKSDANDPTATARMRRYRQRQRNDRNATVTLLRPDQIRPDIDTDKDTNSVANATDAAAASIDPSVAERELFARGREILGKKGGGLIANLLKAKGHNVALARAAIEAASQKENPAEYLAAASRGPPAAKPLTEHQRKQREAKEIVDVLKGSSDSGGSKDIGLLRHDYGE
jgi:hypothetical protein